jgi:outer membrane immunogenic protein
MSKSKANLAAGLVLGLGATFALVGQARAADLPSRKAPPLITPVSVLSWSGFYGGFDAGAIFDLPNATVLATGTFAQGATLANLVAQPYAVPGVLHLNDAGFFAGAVLGWNYQFNKSIVVGLETDFGVPFGSSGATFAAPSSSSYLGVGPLTVSQVGRQADMLGASKARIGFLITPAILLYGTGGLAYGHANTSIGTFTGPMAANFTSPTLGSWRAGWIGGAGMEWMISNALSVKIEYNHFDLGNGTFETRAISQNGPLTTTQSVLGQSRYRGDLVKVGVNFHFNGLGSITGNPVTDFGMPTPTGNVTVDGKAFQNWFNSQASSSGFNVNPLGL